MSLGINLSLKGYPAHKHTSGFMEPLIKETFSLGISGYSPRVNTELSWKNGSSMELYIGGSGGGFIKDTPPITSIGKVYKLSICIEGFGYYGGLKFRLGGVEGQFTFSLSDYPVVYSEDITAISAFADLELFRSTAASGSIIIHSITVVEV